MKHTTWYNQDQGKCNVICNGPNICHWNSILQNECLLVVTNTNISPKLEGLLEHCHFEVNLIFNNVFKFHGHKFASKQAPIHSTLILPFSFTHYDIQDWIWKLCNFDVHSLQTIIYFFINNDILASLKINMTKTNTFKWYLYPQIFYNWQSI